jgi:hypothetical protein
MLWSLHSTWENANAENWSSLFCLYVEWESKLKLKAEYLQIHSLLCCILLVATDCLKWTTDLWYLLFHIWQVMSLTPSVKITLQIFFLEQEKHKIQMEKKPRIAAKSLNNKWNEDQLGILDTKPTTSVWPWAGGRADMVEWLASRSEALNSQTKTQTKHNKTIKTKNPSVIFMIK